MRIEMFNDRGKKTAMVSIEQAAALLDTEDVDAAIRYLSQLRASMRPRFRKSRRARRSTRRK
ncbi:MULTISPECIES: hypothetical protein [Burkholderia]|uniref:hypothetical protein n=1 Tax=Burkholderia TaxID=32008 RepID=UPI000B275C83|nr:MULTISPECIES: hypothetical protein [Burkholderia]